MIRRLRWVAGGAGAALVALLCALAVLATVQARESIPAADGIPAPLAIGTELPRPRQLPPMPLVNEHGRPFSLAAWRGKWIVLAPSMTLCHEVCPLTSGVLMALQERLGVAGLSKRVVVAEATVDPWRDTPARLRAYRRMTGVNLPMLTGTQSEIKRLWSFLGVYYAKVPEGHPADIDWMTHRPERFDVDHTDAIFIIDPHGQERIVDDGMPQISGPLPVPLHRLLDAQGRRNLVHPELPWTAAEILEDLDYLMGRNVPAAMIAAPAPPDRRRAQEQLRGSPTALAGLHLQAGQLLGGETALRHRLAALRGYPVVINVWASWCGPCQQEFPLFATTSARYGRSVGFVGVDTNDHAADARAFLAQHPVSYPSYQSTSSQLSPLAAVDGMPTTLFLDGAGKVIGVHMGQYATSAALDNDIGRYAFDVKG